MRLDMHTTQITRDMMHKKLPPLRRHRRLLHFTPFHICFSLCHMQNIVHGGHQVGEGG